MSDYSKLTNFAVKDGYTTGNPAKVIKGTELDDEFNAIATAVATKFDSSDSASIGALMYPVGSIYINATNSTNPGTLLGFGTWVAFGAGRVPVGFNASDPLFDTAEETGGSKDAIAVSHTHTATSTVTDPGHTHSYTTKTTTTNNTYSQSFEEYNQPVFSSTTTGSNTTGVTVATTVASAGSSGTNANLQPYITVYMWKRTA